MCRSGLLGSPGHLQRQRHRLIHSSPKSSIGGRGEEWCVSAQSLQCRHSQPSTRLSSHLRPPYPAGSQAPCLSLAAAHSYDPARHRQLSTSPSTVRVHGWTSPAIPLLKAMKLIQSPCLAAPLSLANIWTHRPIFTKFSKAQRPSDR